MNNKLKKTIAGIVASAMCTITGINALNVSAAPWEARHVNVPGAPSSEDIIAQVPVYHGAAGATATCNFNSHTNANATSGTTTIKCLSHTMTDKTINNIGSVTLNPNVGAPTYDLCVSYQVSAYTPTSNDVFVSKGNIVKKY